LPLRRPPLSTARPCCIPTLPLAFCTQCATLVVSSRGAPLPTWSTKWWRSSC
jgi:hypothetical protein